MTKVSQGSNVRFLVAAAALECPLMKGTSDAGVACPFCTPGTDRPMTGRFAGPFTVPLGEGARPGAHHFRRGYKIADSFIATLFAF